MRKHILLTILLSCLHIAARGQTITSLDDIDLSGLPQPTQAKALRYWFDDDNGNVTTVSQLSGGQTLDVSSLIDGLHTLHYQVIDENDAVADVRSDLFLKMNGQAGIIQASGLRYWFDDDATSMKTVTAMNGTQTVDASQLLDGLHTIHYQVVGEDGGVYDIASGIFMKMEESASGQVTAKKLMYWFDDETEVLNVDMTEGVQLLDASHLIDGLHTIHYQVLCSNGEMTPAHSSIFMRTSGNEEVAVAQKLRYWFDDAQTATETDITSGIQLLDASSLIDGLHTIHYQVKDSKGMLGSPASSVFMKMDTSSTTASSLRYWFDDDVSSLQVVNVGQGTQTLDVSGLLTGLHTLTYQLIDDKGKVSTPVSRLFMKNFDRQIAEGENRITKYQYWLNKNSAAIQTVTLDNAANPFSLISLLPVQSEPIHSDCFHFEITDGKPTVYAKNVFHIRFYDAAGYFTDDSRKFVDYHVTQAVDAELLEPDAHKTTAKPVEDAIKWYCLTAEPGDSVQFHLDRAATLELFAPSGEEVLSASGADVVKWFGCHVRETGTYYVALHDVTATWGDDISIDYEHIDKYAVLRQDVAVVGNGGCSTITFEGNGYRDLYAVDLFTAQGDSVHHVYIGHESDATTSVIFDFTGAALGQYNAVFRFTGEDKVFNNLVTVEEARDIELATTVTYPSAFVSGLSTTYTINITNNGNMTAYNVPLYSNIFCHTVNGISHVSINGLDLKTLYDSFNNFEEWTESEIKEFKNWSDRIGEDHYFVKQRVTDEITGDSIVVRNGVFFLELAPNITKTITITISATEEIEALFSISKEWTTYYCTNNRGIKKAPRRNEVKDWFCCNHEKIECIANLVSQTADIAGIFPMLPASTAIGVAGCLSGLINQISDVSSDVFCSGDTPNINPGNQLKDIAKGISWYSWILSCLNNFVPSKKAQNVISAICAVGDLPSTMQSLVGVSGSCRNAWSKQNPNCPPNPGGGGGTSTPSIPYDPNDIFGYTAESGSKTVKEGQRDVYYTIEFENDPEFATSSAHNIYVTDTLDATKFDLSTFTPTRVKIGENSAELKGDKNFVTTIDMRPGINCIAQVEGTFDEQTGIARWHISSLDPMTMEPTKYVMDGVLPVNHNGNGIGEVMYDIKLKSDLAHGTEVNNRAGIVFDTNEVIMTPTWTNIIDRIAPESHITKVEALDNSTAAVTVSATDELSGPWQYDVYVQYGTGSAWMMGAENVPIDSVARVKIYHGINHGFYVVVTDSAGNVEQKQAAREFELVLGDVIAGDANSDGKVSISDAVAIVNHLLGNDLLGFSSAAADINHDGEVTISDAVDIVNMILGNNSSLNIRRKEQDP